MPLCFAGGMSLIALCTASLTFAGVEVNVNGIQLLDRGNSQFLLRSPCYRASNGAYRPSLILPRQIWNELATQAKERTSGGEAF
jgi:hypothetical protein